jgi:hypothetical protein
MIQNTELTHLLKNINDKETIKNYFMVLYGQFNQDMVIATVKVIETKLILEKFQADVITKTKVICTEILQNITKHQKMHDTTLPYFIIGSNDGVLNIMAGNVITEKSKNYLVKKLEEYKKIKADSFKEYYLNAFKNSVLTEEGNAGLGLLEITYRSNQNVKYNVQNIAEGFFSFNLDVIVNKPIIAN